MLSGGEKVTRSARKCDPQLAVGGVQKFYFSCFSGETFYLFKTGYELNGKGSALISSQAARPVGEIDQHKVWLAVVIPEKPDQPILPRAMVVDGNVTDAIVPAGIGLPQRVMGACLVRHKVPVVLVVAGHHAHIGAAQIAERLPEVKDLKIDTGNVVIQPRGGSVLIQDGPREGWAVNEIAKTSKAV